MGLSLMRVKKGRKEKESKRSERRLKARQTLGTFGNWLFLLLIDASVPQQKDHKEGLRQ